MSAHHVYFESQGLHLHALEWGAVKAPAIVLLHGLRSYGATWELVAERLDSRYRLIALDQRGRGDSEWDPSHGYFTPTYVADVEALVQHLGLERFILVGHSMGGTNALVYTQRHPRTVRALVIEDIGPGSSASGEGAERIRREVASTPSTFASWEDGRAFWRARRPLVTEGALDSRVHHSMRELPDGRIGWKYDAVGIAQARLDPDPALIVDLWPSVKSLRCPTLLLRGAESDFLPADTARRMVEAAPCIEWFDIAGASHYVHDDNPADFLSQLEAFLMRVEAAEGVRP